MDNSLAQELQQIQQQTIINQNLLASTITTNTNMPSMAPPNIQLVSNFMGMPPQNFSVPPPNGQMFFPPVNLKYFYLFSNIYF